MKIAIAAVGEKPGSLISEEGGRAPYYLIYEDNKLVETWPNPMRTGGGGAGFGVASVMQEKGVNKVVAGVIGGNMKQALDEAGIEAEEVSDMMVKDYLKL